MKSYDKNVFLTQRIKVLVSAQNPLLVSAAPSQAIGEAVKNASVVYLTAPGHAVIFGRAEYAIFLSGRTRRGAAYDIDRVKDRQQLR